MNPSITLGTFKGTAVRIHVTFVLFFIWVAVSGYLSGGAAAARNSLLLVTLIFVSVVLHEFGHIFTARRFGVACPQVTLLPIGGVASVERMPDNPLHELQVALAGPAVNVVIAMALYAVGGAIEPSANFEALQELIAKLGRINLLLALFNLIPAFPMDGGRALRALLAMWIRPQRATEIAAAIGCAFALPLGLFGLWGGNPVLVLIAVFVYFSARAESRTSAVSEMARQMTVEEAMETLGQTIGWGASVGEAAATLLANPQHAFAVTSSSGQLMGIVGRKEIIHAAKTENWGAPIAPFIHKEVPKIVVGASVDTTLAKLAVLPAVAIIDASGSLCGLLTRRRLAEVIMLAGILKRFPSER